ncbi:uncharacterized protein METZ01_LOCUS132850 [marine metagenome]|uniref:Uncharacterized protein n=1 Tax=marine metagenome TaxID=408172 RepID=A0A381YSI2_9ZZZZ
MYAVDDDSLYQAESTMGLAACAASYSIYAKKFGR